MEIFAIKMKTYLFNSTTDETIYKESIVDNMLYQTLENAVKQLELLYDYVDIEGGNVEYYIETYTLQLQDDYN
tara:strand:+ start:415 stop:633 length:219 start_codon:yes stop_codon:yes gene_type:complete